MDTRAINRLVRSQLDKVTAANAAWCRKRLAAVSHAKSSLVEAALDHNKGRSQSVAKNKALVNSVQYFFSLYSKALKNCATLSGCVFVIW